MFCGLISCLRWGVGLVGFGGELVWRFGVFGRFWVLAGCIVLVWGFWLVRFGFAGTCFGLVI